MAFMSTMALGLKKREQTREKKTGEREGNERMRKEEREESDNIIIIYNYTMLLQYHLICKMVL